MPKYRDIPMGQRIDKIGEPLAKGIYLYLEAEKANKEKMGKKAETDESTTDQGKILPPLP